MVNPGGTRFAPGTHIRVRRRLGYFHHGIYESDDEVIQFGGRILEKPTATVGVVSLGDFENGGDAEAVEHGREDSFLRALILPRPPWLPEADAPEVVIRRARWLVANHPPRRYHLVGYNCEHAANFCATGWYTESHQVPLFLWSERASRVSFRLQVRQPGQVASNESVVHPCRGENVALGHNDHPVQQEHSPLLARHWPQMARGRAVRGRRIALRLGLAERVACLSGAISSELLFAVSDSADGERLHVFPLDGDRAVPCSRSPGGSATERRS